MIDTAAKTPEPGSLEALLGAVMEQHPRPWYRDGISIRDAHGGDVLDLEQGWLSHSVIDFLMKLGELKNA